MEFRVILPNLTKKFEKCEVYYATLRGKIVKFVRYFTLVLKRLYNKYYALIAEFKMKKSNKDYIKLKSNSVRTLIDSSSNGKAVRFSCVSNEMLKYGNTPLVTDTLTYLYEWMINSGSAPEFFNSSILKPLVKDSKKSPDDLNNLRPLSISDVYTTVYEKILLNEVSLDHKDHPKQFGFKVNSSCAHVNFILSEIVRLSKKRKRKHMWSR